MLKSILASLLTIPLFAGIPQDKVKHVVAGAIIGGTVTWIAKENGSRHPELWGIGAAVLAGALKEAYDRKRPHNRWDGRDLSATAAGGIVISYTIRF